MEVSFEQISHPKAKHTGTKTLFANPKLERLTRTHIAVPVTAFVLYSVALLGYCFYNSGLSTATILLLFPTGLLTFSLIEYVAHKYLYHMGATSERRARFQYHFHGVHHEFPKDKTRLAIPPWISSVVAAGLLWVIHFLIGDAALAFFSGFLMGYAGYLLVHYSVHIFNAPKNSFKVLWVNHAMHHYKDPHMAFGVSTPLWDYVFGTMPPKEPKRDRVVVVK